MSIIFHGLPQQQNPRYQYHYSRNINNTSVACLYSLSLLITTLKYELSVMLITGDCLSAKIVSSNSLLMLQSQFFLNRFAFICLWTMQFFLLCYYAAVWFSPIKDKLEHVVKMCLIFFLTRENIDGCNPGVCEKRVTRYANCIHVTFASFYYHLVRMIWTIRVHVRT